jgi:sRNA-binding carbon storage regulator CsrA
VLVVTRKQNESIIIEPIDGLDPSMTVREAFAHGSIVVTLADVGPRRVRIAIDAPTVLRITRREAEASTTAPQTTEPPARRAGSRA